MERENIRTIIYLVLTAVNIGILIFFLYNSGVINPKAKSTYDLERGNCSNLSINDTAYCLNDKVMEFFHYNESNLGKDISYERLKKEGGVCHHYALLYQKAGKELGFYTEKPIIHSGNGSSHTFAIISNDEGYCLLDQTDVFCFLFG